MPPLSRISIACATFSLMHAYALLTLDASLLLVLLPINPPPFLLSSASTGTRLCNPPSSGVGNVGDMGTGSTGPGSTGPGGDFGGGGGGFGTPASGICQSATSCQSNNDQPTCEAAECDWKANINSCMESAGACGDETTAAGCTDSDADCYWDSYVKECGKPKGYLGGATGGTGSSDNCGSHQSEDDCEAETADSCKWSESSGGSPSDFGDFGDFGGGASSCSTLENSEDCTGKLNNGDRACSWESAGGAGGAGGIGGTENAGGEFDAGSDGGAGAGGAAGIGDGDGLEEGGVPGAGVDQTGDAGAGGAEGADFSAVGGEGGSIGFCIEYDECREVNAEDACAAVSDECTWNDDSGCRGASADGMPGGMADLGPRCADKASVFDQAGAFVETTTTTTMTTTTAAAAAADNTAELEAAARQAELDTLAAAAAAELAAANATKVLAEAAVAQKEEEKEALEEQIEAVTADVAGEDCGTDPTAAGLSAACASKILLEQQVAILATQLEAAQLQLATAERDFRDAETNFASASALAEAGADIPVAGTGSNVGLIVGVVVGVLALVAIVAVVATRKDASKSPLEKSNDLVFLETRT